MLIPMPPAPPQSTIDNALDIDIEDHHLGFVDIEQVMMDDVVAAQAAVHQHDEWGQGGYGAAAAVAPDLLNLLQLPTGSVSFGGWAEEGSAMYDPSSALHLGYANGQDYAAEAAMREMYGLQQAIGAGLPLQYQQQQQNCGGYGGGVFGEVVGMDGGMGVVGGKGVGMGVEGKGNFVTERQRRQQLNGKYAALRSLIPNPTKHDRASVVGDAIEYIKELLRTVDEFKILVQKKKHGRIRKKMLIKPDHHDKGATGDVESSSSMRPQLGDDHEQYPLNGALRSSLLQRRSRDGFIDVRIVDDEVNIKLNQKNRPNCLLYIAKALEELQLDLVHVSGGNIGDSYVFMLNTKICEGSSVYAGAIAKKLLEVMDRHYPALPFPGNNAY